MDYIFFTELLSYGEEFVLYYKKKKFYISQRIDLGEIYLTVPKEGQRIFKNYNELLEAPVMEGKTLAEMWDILEVY